MSNKRAFVKSLWEINWEIELFERLPLAIIASILECFDSEGQQQLEIPEHVGKAFVRRVQKVMGDVPVTNSLDQAFGDHTAQQRDAFRELERRRGVVSHVTARCRELRPDGKKGRFETAIAEAAPKLGLTEDNVREKNKATRPVIDFEIDYADLERISPRSTGHVQQVEKGPDMAKIAQLPMEGFVRLPLSLKVVPVSRTTWWNGVASGRFPKPGKLGPRITAWRVEVIWALIE